MLFIYLINKNKRFYFLPDDLLSYSLIKCKSSYYVPVDFITYNMIFSFSLTIISVQKMVKVYSSLYLLFNLHYFLIYFSKQYDAKPPPEQVIFSVIYISKKMQNICLIEKSLELLILSFLHFYMTKNKFQNLSNRFLQIEILTFTLGHITIHVEENSRFNNRSNLNITLISIDLWYIVTLFYQVTCIRP